MPGSAVQNGKAGSEYEAKPNFASIYTEVGQVFRTKHVFLMPFNLTETTERVDKTTKIEQARKSGFPHKILVPLSTERQLGTSDGKRRLAPIVFVVLAALFFSYFMWRYALVLFLQWQEGANDIGTCAKPVMNFYLISNVKCVSMLTVRRDQGREL